MDKLLKASAWYAVTYETAQNAKPNIWNSAPPTSFPWNTCDDYLNRIKGDYGDSSRRRLATTVADTVLPSLHLR